MKFSVKKFKLSLLTVIAFSGLFFVLTNSAVYGQTTTHSTCVSPAVAIDPPEITNVQHTPLNPDDEVGIYISATITDSDGLSSTKLYYRAQGASTFNTTDLIQESSTDVYGVTIGPYVANLTVEYYIYAVDASSFNEVAIDTNGGLYYNFTTSEADHEAPIITNVQHSPETPTDEDLVIITCNVTDVSEVTVLLNYRVNGSAWANQTMVNQEGNLYNATVGEFNPGTLFEYRIYAIDYSIDNNTALENAGGENYYFTVVVNDLGGPNIFDLVVSPDPVFSGQTVNLECTVTDALSGILNVTLVYRINNGTWLEADFFSLGENLYSVDIGPFKVGDVIDYYIIAFDNSTNTNIAINNNGDANYSFTVLENTLDVSLYALVPIVALAALGLINRRRK